MLITNIIESKTVTEGFDCNDGDTCTSDISGNPSKCCNLNSKDFLSVQISDPNSVSITIKRKLCVDQTKSTVQDKKDENKKEYGFKCRYVASA